MTGEARETKHVSREVHEVTSKLSMLREGQSLRRGENGLASQIVVPWTQFDF